MMYGSERWGLNKRDEMIMEVAEMRTFKWTAKLDKIGNECVKGSSGYRKENEEE